MSKKSLRFAAIDIGSNAIRMLLTHVFEGENGPSFKRESLLRMPIRLGEDVFSRQAISHQKAHQLLLAMCAFKQLLQVFEPHDMMACATSAMRDASNGEEILREIHQVAGLSLQIISGAEEAQLLFSNSIAEKLEGGKTYLYIDVGGGSTELNLFHDQELLAAQSFNIGTVRLLQGAVSLVEWRRMLDWVDFNVPVSREITAIGTGGNINKLASLVGAKKQKKPVRVQRIFELYKELKQYSYRERMEKYRLKPDRADVIVPAADIYLTVMRRANIRHILVPEVGLADGMIRKLYQDYQGC